ncbi:hypothetical protein BCR44DRAFT_1256995 [Catenaria anguillulae PL171]|uniref:Uncharacterized protein n=1 Tax=Catenaria anguillulae PL171 TaxID=765915 RepID=A0A1Y2HBL0_9FUNG|nr:hypothetical protein BCR44DRAFT_1256995 [Catenaria anguillulae PL171]
MIPDGSASQSHEASSSQQVSNSLPVTQRGSRRSFALATCFMTLLCNAVSLLAFAAAIVTWPQENPKLVDKYNGNAVRAVYDVVVWGLLGLIAKQHYSIIYAPLVQTRTFTAILWSFFALLIGFHVVNVINPTNDPGFADARVFGEIISNMAFLICYVVIPLYLKWSLTQALKTQPHLFPPQEKSRIFSLLIAAMACYYVSRTVKMSTISIPLYVATIVIVIVACILTSTMISRGKVYARHFDFNLLLHCAYGQIRVILRLLGSVLTLDWSKRYSSIIIFIFRTLNGIGVVLMDDTMEAVFAAPILWCDLYARLGESLTSTAAALNYTWTVQDAILYLVPNLIFCILKDGGASDDLRFYITHRVCLLNRLPTPTGELPPTLTQPNAGFTAEQPEKLTAKPLPSGHVPTIAASAPVEETPETSGSPNGAVGDADAPPLPQPCPQVPKRSTQALFTPSLNNEASKSTTSLSSDVESGGKHESKKATISSKNRLINAVKDMQTDLRLQVTRSEQTLIARIVSVFVLSNAYLLALGLGATRADRIRLRTPGEGHLIPALILGGTAVEVVLARWIATKVFRWKIQRLDQWRIWARQRKIGKERSESVHGLTGTHTQQKASAVATRAIGGMGSGAGSSSPVQLWVTRLPQRRDFLMLLVMSCTYACTIVMGAWP